MTSDTVAASLAALEAFPAALRAQVASLDDATLRFRPAGEWSAIENVGHLIDIESVWMGRYQQMLSAENPAFPRVDVDEIVRRAEYQNKNLDNLLQTFAGLRAEAIPFLRMLKPMHLDRPGVHPVRGPMTVASGIGIHANHDQLHADQIAKTVAQA
ncbi:MAG: DinB family protein [Roseiflexaceae bacterium]|nr:DinB family protein [Roseiflexaceae bacterium]